MKRHLILFACIISLSGVLACKQQPIEDSAATTKEFQPKTFSQQTLQFESEQALYDTMLKVMSMGAEEQAQWYAETPGFVSMAQARDIVSKEIAQCRTQEQVEAVKKAYSSMFIFNNNPGENDLTPYTPTNQTHFLPLCNAYGNIEVGGKIINVIDVKEYKDTWCAKVEANTTQAPMAKGYEAAQNSLHIWTDSRKMWLDAYRMDFSLVNETRLFLRFGAQQKICAIFCFWNSYTNELSIYGSRTPPFGFTYSSEFASGSFTKVLNDGASMCLGHRSYNNGNGVTQLSVTAYSQGVGADNAARMDIYL